VRQLYADRLAAEGVLNAGEAASMMEQYRSGLDEGKPQARAALGLIGNRFTVDWSDTERGLGAGENRRGYGASAGTGKGDHDLSTDWTLHPRVLAIMLAREKMVTAISPWTGAAPRTLPTRASSRTDIRSG